MMTLGVAWIIIRLGYRQGWQNAFGVTTFTAGMLMMFAASTLYHWHGGLAGNRWLRVLDHVSIYVMIAASYTPICIGVVGGALGWSVFGVLWGVVALGTCYKVFALGRWPRLSLLLYLMMGWSGVLIALPVWRGLAAAPLACILLEGVLYTGGTWFFAHDSRPYFHAVWHVFVLLGAMSHWAAILLILLG